MAAEFDVYLNGKGYQLAKDSQGRIVSSAYKEQRSDPFMHYVSTAERWKRKSFRFEGGAGCTLEDGSKRYRRGRMDTRGGNALLPPKLNLCQTEQSSADPPVFKPAVPDTVADGDAIKTGAAGFAVKITLGTSASPTIRSLAALVRREAGSFAGGSDVRLELWDTSGAGGRPGARMTTSAGHIYREPGAYWYGLHDPWKSEEYFWLTLNFSAAQAVVSGGTYWLVLVNPNSGAVYWGRKDTDTSASTSTSASGSGGWTAAATGQERPYYRVYYHGTEIDAEVVKFCEFRGTGTTGDNVNRLYAGCGPRVLYFDPGTEKFFTAYELPSGDCSDLIVFNEMLFAAQGEGAPLAWSDGSGPSGGTPPWTEMAADPTNHTTEGQVLALHDALLWKANGAQVRASADGLASAWGATAVTVGDPGTQVQAMVSHGGKLYAAKPEGIFEIWYPDTYPEDDNPYANLVHDFRTDLAARPWMLDWHSALYFPGSAGLFEWKSGILRDLFSSLSEGDDAEAAKPLDHMVQADLGNFLACCGTTRGLFAAMMSGHLNQTTIWYYRSQAWHPLWNDDATLAEYCRALYYESMGAGQGRLWIAKGANIGYFYVPVWTDDCSLDDRAYYDDAGYIELPRFDDGKAYEAKDWYSVEIRAQNVGAGAGGTIKVYYLLDDPKGAGPTVSAWTQMPGSPVTTSGTTSLYFGANTYTGSIRLRLDVTGGLNTDTVEIEEVTIKFHPMPDTVILHQCIIRAAAGIVKHGGGRDHRTAYQIWEELSGLDQVMEPWTFIDPLGRSHQVKVVGVTPVAVRQIEGPGAELDPDVTNPVLMPYTVEAQVMVSMIEV